MSIKPEIELARNDGRPSVPTDGLDSYSTEESEFIRAIGDYMRKYNRRFPRFTEVLAVVKSLGYRLVAEPECLPKPAWWRG